VFCNILNRAESIPALESAECRIVLLETSFDISRPADIGSAIIFAAASQHINEEEHFVSWERSNQDGLLHVSLGY
jgi:hypothetical protein